MKLKDVFEQAIEFEYIDLQALIMFLVFEKEVLSMEDDAKELDLYFLEKHNQRMNKELHAYKKKMNMKYSPSVFEIKNQQYTGYIYAHSIAQAKYIAHRHLIKVDEIKEVDLDKFVTSENKQMTLRNLIKNKEPGILGGYEVKNYASLRPRKSHQNS